MITTNIHNVLNIKICKTRSVETEISSYAIRDIEIETSRGETITIALFSDNVENLNIEEKEK